ncbi:DUF4124 domain-containing protein [Alteromonas antoniana]|uniref:DUF4124 domain-containing protein n=1 Tax=Alteromonas antoniana TaxID=2803813 RepID=UPI001C455090|nr:DUF4124 domain-containing protein [Alteromonas antoniana]
MALNVSYSLMDSCKRGFMKQFISPLLLLTALTLPVMAQDVYKVVKEDGTVLYTDTPVKGSESVTMPPSTENVSESIADPAIVKPSATNSSARKDKVEYSVSITTPQPEATIRNNLGNFTITSTATPANAGGRFQLWFDGSVAETNATGMFHLSGINRGAHDYYIEWIDNKGKTLASTEKQTLYLHQASALINNN